MADPITEMKARIESTIMKIDEGEIDPLKGLLDLKYKKYALETLVNQIKDYESDNLELFSQASEAHGGYYNGHDITVRSGGIAYSFKNIPEWQEIEAKKKAVEAKYKSLYKAKQQNVQMATEDGEEVILPEISYRKSSIVIKKQKT